MALVAWIGRMDMLGRSLLLGGGPSFVRHTRADGAVDIPIEGALSMRAPMRGWLQAGGRQGRAGLLAGDRMVLGMKMVVWVAWRVGWPMHHGSVACAGPLTG